MTPLDISTLIFLLAYALIFAITQYPKKGKTK